MTVVPGKNPVLMYISKSDLPADMDKNCAWRAHYEYTAILSFVTFTDPHYFWGINPVFTC